MTTELDKKFFENILSVIPDGNFPEKIDVLKEHLLQLDQVEVPITHHFAPGVYVREMDKPAGVLTIGKIHKFEHIKMLLKGDVTFITEHGTFRVQAPFIERGMPGQNIATYSHTDMVMITIHPTESTDLEEIEKQFICQDRKEYQQFLEKQQALEKEQAMLNNLSVVS